MTGPVLTPVSRERFLVGWVADRGGLCGICNAAAPRVVNGSCICPTGCDVEAAYQRAGYEPGITAANTALLDAAVGRVREPLVLVCAKDVQPEDVQWLWPGYLARGKLVCIDGPPGCGKTTVAMDGVARITRGSPMPGTDERTAPTTVLIAGVEDGWADTIRPRLDAAGADLSRVHFVTVANNGSFTVPDDVDRLADAIRSTGAGWVHIDSIMGTLAEGVRTYGDQSVRRALGPLKDMAQNLGVLVTFIRHPRKAGAASAVDAGGGSIAFSALSRIVLYVGYDPTDTTDDPNARRRVIAVAKNNLSRTPDSLAFQVVSAANGHPCIAWGGVTDVTADDMASAPMRLRAAGDDAATKKAAAAAWLKDMLGTGARLTAKELEMRAVLAGHVWRTVERAATDSGVIKERGKVGEPSVWYLPTIPQPVAPRGVTTVDDGATAGETSQPLFPVAPPVAPHGASGATGFAPDGDVRSATVAPTALVLGRDGATGSGKRYGGADHAA